ncbi:MAG: hypothetical protein D6772_17410 [Bacteroidetes bacterium]|nr:MAG: hypothetical protein D6772_17410 [Bacteroidota bacterium]
MWQDFFYFSKTEKRGVLVLILLCLALLTAPYFWPDASQDPATDFRDFQNAVAKWEENTTETDTTANSGATEEVMLALFDPNAPDREVLAALDLSERAIRAWMSYTAKGGRFYDEPDLEEFRALSASERERVKPYLQFPQAKQPATKEYQANKEETAAALVPLYPFDPNQITQEELIAFGVPAKAAVNWTKFLEAGGRFRQTADIEKIYGLPPEWSERLQAFVRVSTTKSNSPNAQSRTVGAPTSTRTPVTIDINRAEAEEWQQLYGIGPVLSKRIVNFRDKLGGFYRVEQVGETYGLPDSTFQRILPQLRPSPLLRPLYINQASEEELAAHPYIHRLSAKLIVNYRREHGAFKNIEDLHKLYGLEEGLVERIQPYLIFE